MCVCVLGKQLKQAQSTLPLSNLYHLIRSSHLVLVCWPFFWFVSFVFGGSKSFTFTLTLCVLPFYLVPLLSGVKAKAR